MVMSNAEHQRKYKQRSDADCEKRQKYLQRSIGHYVRDRETGRNKSICDITDSEIRLVRKKWRNQKTKDKERAKI